MKKAYALSKSSLLAMFMILSVVFACKDDDDEPTPPANNDPIVATWQLTAVSPAAGSTLPVDPATLVPCIYSLKLTFKADNTIATADCPNAVTLINAVIPINGAKWEVKDGNLILKDSANNTKSFKYTLNGSDLEVTVDDAAVIPGSPAIDVVLKFKKV
ncbi:lipocalin family protein [Dyadobacter sp. 676]|uniref:Lipocalin family protein n=1 Tax=Dyadobacter sp. 676 TaxID=3088362 RepID=A0AAU8FRS4_9BACT